jgi:selenocysteine lyase/cysteine desulfurase
MIDNIISNYTNLNEKIINKLVYSPGIIDTPFEKNINIIYADYIASGKPSPIIEQYLIDKIYPFYSNTHSNANNGIKMKTIIANTKDYIRTLFNLTIDYKILFTGNGTTGAINHLVNCIEYSLYERIIIYLSLYEHYSNHIPWVELLHQDKQIIYVPFLTSSEMIDLDYLESSIDKLISTNLNRRTLVICSITACSNINGTITPLTRIRDILDKIPPSSNICKYFFSDFACSAPYVKIDGSIFDAFFFSPHKFIGGVATPGILISKTCLFSKPKPYCMGGGCVQKASSHAIIYETDIERRESAGTPNIIGIIKIGKILQLKEKFQSIIEHNEHIIYKLIKYKISKYKISYPNFRPVMYESDNEHLPILSFNILPLHYNFVVVLFNDLFGIQTRGGIGCCGLLAEHTEKEYGYRGWCRISFHWSMSIDTILHIFKSLEFIIEKGHLYYKYYIFDEKQNLYLIK